ncbi:cryptochrome/photolyase family protein [Arcobacter porcinus]|uniref:FAD binding domain of DNA photolyase n=1 Tax=Arcobacter porcinus TaxID=1935204 RepID=A0ABX2YBE7_9BACT|nr:cryptochrome/photolyase family protein [Arcobacter porcinus]OCL84177.1 FAD binding domain of DNA photolyase [Arcobacter porcinus]OCL84703.1 FAD binding domain of DNA photolyase [Arcobacter porcinus]OCL89241.1 FAD binding domain of DNA photolyase [Arcobacter porcinus]OCL91661.1 FAD binding domain of DNA photolyase [Arcobacter porcinus]
MKIFILYPNQLFKNISNFVDKRVLLVEEPLFFDKYSFDEDNRKKLQKDIKIPPTLAFENEFVKEKFENFGFYQDAITKDTKQSFLFHSNISSSLNIGLIDLNELIEKIVNSQAPYNAKEGFIRQIIGWREFMLRVYEDDGILLRNSNFFEFKNPILKKIIEAKSGIQILDDSIKKLELTAYNHHIERLMILGNIFLLLEIKPNEVYEFFMKNYIDAYDWVMVGNVYGMSGFSDGGSITTKPYIASSNYLLKMSDYSKESWCEILDSLYWRFLHKYSFKFEKNPRMKMQIALLNKMPKEKLENHLLVAKKFIDDIFITN